MKNETSAKVLVSMPSKKSAKILSEIHPASAATISEQIKRLQMPNHISDESLQERNIKKLATIYQQMDIERAISIIETLDNETAVSILSKMNEKRLARILELVETDEASKLIGKIRKIMKKQTQKNNKILKGA
jgi:flagellar motility protein MotE (MotC chaperone)